MRIVLPIFILSLCIHANSARADDSLYERAPINYSTAPAADPVAHLITQIKSGKVSLNYDSKTGYLPALLKALNIPISSQLLVFSKTSFQRDLINPEHP